MLPLLLALAFTLPYSHSRALLCSPAWQYYLMIGGLLSWVGFLKSGLHPALALVPIVPFMPGPNATSLDHLDCS